MKLQNEINFFSISETEDLKESGPPGGWQLQYFTYSIEYKCEKVKKCQYKLSKSKIKLSDLEWNVICICLFASSIGQPLRFHFITLSKLDISKK